MIAAQMATIVRFAELVALHHRTHTAIEDKDVVTEQFGDALSTVHGGAISVSGRDFLTSTNAPLFG